MLGILRRRLTFANVVALIALFVSLGSGVYAATKISGKKIKKESIAGNRLKPEGVTGQQVDESSLGKVRSAQSADSAQVADSARVAESAQKLVGTGPEGFVSSSNVRRWHFEATVADDAEAVTEVFDVGSLRLGAVCSDGPPRTSFFLGGQSSAPAAGWDAGIVRRGGIGGTAGGLIGSGTETFTIAQPENDFAREVGTLVYNAGNETITVTYALFVNDGNGSGHCNLVVTAMRATD